MASPDFFHGKLPTFLPGEDVMLRPGQVPEAKKPKAPTGELLVLHG